MEKYVIEGGVPLYGEVEIQSAKNAVLPLLAAAVLTEGRVVIHKCLAHHRCSEHGPDP